MPNALATAKYQKLFDDISDLYENARKAQVVFAWETGKRIVNIEQDGEMRAVSVSGDTYEIPIFSSFHQRDSMFSI